MGDEEKNEIIKQIEITLAKLGVAHTKDIANIKREIRLRSNFTEHALKLQAREYERRLDILNGEAQRLKDMQETYVLKTEWDIKHDALCKIVDDLQSFKDNMSGRQSIITVVIASGISLLISVITALIIYLFTGV